MAPPRPSEQQRLLNRLAELSNRELAAVWKKLNLERPERLAEPLVEVLAALVGRYGSAAATLAADFYDEAREAAGAPGSFRAIPAPEPETERLEALARWGVGPLFAANPDPAGALSLLSGGTQRQVLAMGRHTTEGSATLDPAGPAFARHASANACAFCRMLATRGAAYTSREAAERVGGRGTPLSTNIGRKRGRMAKGIRARGTQSLGSKYHDHCHCVAVPVWPDQTYEPAPYIAEWSDQYAASVQTGGRHGAIDVSDTLATWRAEFGAK